MLVLLLLVLLKKTIERNKFCCNAKRIRNVVGQYLVEQYLGTIFPLCCYSSTNPKHFCMPPTET